ncbi:2Fe-2S iron-sulfur cluster-binding protein [Sedimenticola hydrogenitrophicus]|uniref:2Fe-2S iron-sulfur cluster-binding protein n=1 Tax=Sedimenticola hydrogenitrophicus TaxID=2967975 RepID=UPI0023AFBE71|nr:2Fe-2S iron-sulfur cluster-binding protein [Sedimenticola hydrogenitrophicus]
MTTGTLALIILAALGLQVGLFALNALNRRRARFCAATAVPTATDATAWKGFREFVVQRRVTEDAQGTICSFYLRPVDGRPLPPFKPGQFLTFRLPVDDPAGSRNGSVIRCYSLSDAPHPDYYRVTIKRVPAPPGQPALPSGVASNFFHDRVTEGSRLEVRAPAGHFHLQEQDQSPVVLIGGGIGITPMLSMLNRLLESGSPREIWLFYGIRNGREEIMGDHLRSLAEQHANFHLYCCYSAPTDGEAAGLDFQHRGRVDVPLLRATLKPAYYQFYLCGPPAMMESLAPGLEELGIGDIFYESFGPATLARPGATERQSETAAAEISVTFGRSGRQIAWDRQAGSLLEFAEAQGIEVDAGCRAGSCGGCQTPIESGDVVYDQPAVAEVEPGHCLLCITRPKNDLTLAA